LHSKIFYKISCSYARYNANNYEELNIIYKPILLMLMYVCSTLTA